MSSKRHQLPPQHPQQGNPLCQQIGHLWDTSANVVKDYRCCTRAQCHTAERLVRGRWRTVSTPTRTPPASRSRAAVQPTLFRPGVDYYDQREERRAERALFDMLRH